MKKNKILKNILTHLMLFALMVFSVNALQSNVDAETNVQSNANIGTTDALTYNMNEVRVNGVIAQSNLEITTQTESQGRTQLTVELRNGQEVEIKIMPDTASENALAMLKVGVCSSDNNCSIQLKSVGNGDSEKVQYEMQLEQDSKIFGIFQKKMEVNAYVDAQTGETEVHKPWWAFMATVSAE